MTRRRVTLTLEWGRVEEDLEPQREGQADALVERADPWPRPIGFDGRHPPDDSRR